MQQAESTVRAGFERQWRAVQARDPRYDGAFVYAVRSTGIYCRPSCPARRPGRHRVLFFPSVQAAEAKGFRPCRRCLPQTASSRHPAADAVRDVCRYIEGHLDERLTLSGLAERVAMGPFALHRAFKRLLGVTPREYADAERVRRLKAGLAKGENVTTALYEAGYSSSSRLYERAASRLGMTPAIYRRGGPGMSIRSTIVPCPLGRMLVAATPRGICSVCLGESDQALRRALEREYPRAEIRNDGAGLRAYVQALVRHLGGSEPKLDLPLDVRATAFQQRVWAALCRIPYGATRTYSEVARSIGRPRAVRAVARACATNPTCIVVPCHRVVRSDGGLGGYRWGIERKQALLDREKRGAARRKQ
jgi:AraC family transcriptional regulator, regulatory protein of adaptative response / methylated-DNA-[protein]-cysteine methyltransferase